MWIGDRWNKPMDGGYRDFSINIRMSNGAIIEFQLHHRGIIEAKKGEAVEGLGHLIYIFMRPNRYRDDMVECTAQAMKVSELWFIKQDCWENWLTWTLMTKPQPQRLRAVFQPDFSKKKHLQLIFSKIISGQERSIFQKEVYSS